MGATYTIFGRQIGSHYVGSPGPPAYADAPSTLLFTSERKFTR